MPYYPYADAELSDLREARVSVSGAEHRLHHDADAFVQQFVCERPISQRQLQYQRDAIIRYLRDRHEARRIVMRRNYDTGVVTATFIKQYVGPSWGEWRRR